MIDVCLLGCGGMMPLPGRFLTSLYVRTDGRAVLIEGSRISVVGNRGVKRVLEE